MAKGSIELEYQCKHDDAWYLVSVERRGNGLVVHYLEAGDDCEYDEILSMEEFKSSISRFRLACRHLQDQHCDQVKEGLEICALFITDAQDVKFFDAIVKQVCKSEHCSIDDEDQCTCTFKVLWKAGPNAHRITSVPCQNICLLTKGSIESHPVIREFSKHVQSDEQELSLDLNSMAVELEADQMNSNLSADIRKEGRKHSEDYSLSAHCGMSRLSSSSAMENWDEGYNCGRKSEELTVEENQKDEKIMEGSVGKKVFLHYSRGNVKRWALKNSEMFTSGRQVQDYNQTDVNVKASKKLVQHGDDLDSFENSNSSYLATSHLKQNRSHSTMERFACSAYLQGFTGQNSENLEKNVKVIQEYKQPIQQLSDNELSPQKVPINACEISSYKSSHLFQLQSDASNDINALRSSGLTTSDVKINTQNNPSYGFKDSSDHPDQTGSKVHIVIGANKHNQPKRNKIGSPELLPAVVNISSDEEDDYSPSKKKCDYGSQNLNKQRDNHAQLQKELSTVDEIEVDCTCICECHRNVQSRNEKITIFRCNYEGQKNVSAIQHHCNGHSVSEKSNSYPSVYLDSADTSFFDSDHNLRRNLHLTYKECQKTSPSSMKLYSRPSQSNIRQSSLPAYDQCRTYFGNSVTAHCKYFFHSSMCSCNELHISDVSVFSEDESIYDGEGTSDLKDSNCKHCGKCMTPMLSSKRANTTIQMGLNESRCGCKDAGCGHCSGDVRTEERKFYSSEFLVLDNLEKDVSPFDVKEVITSMGCKVVHVYILPTLKLEQFTRGFVWFQDRANLMKALGCLQDDNVFVVSSNGRPWVVLDIDDGVFGTGSISEGFNIQSKYRKQCTPSKILVIHKGTEDFEKAKRRKNLFLEFKEQLILLHKRLQFEEKMFNEP